MTRNGLWRRRLWDGEPQSRLKTPTSLEMQDPATCAKMGCSQRTASLSTSAPTRHVPERRDREDPATERRRWDREVRYHCVTCPLAGSAPLTNRAKIRVGIHKPSCPCTVEQRTRNGERLQRTRPKVERKLGHLMRRRHGGSARECAENYGLQPTSVFSLPQPTLHASPSSRFVRSKAEMDDGRNDKEVEANGIPHAPSRPVIATSRPCFATSSTPSRGAKNAFSTTSSARQSH